MAEIENVLLLVELLPFMRTGFGYVGSMLQSTDPFRTCVHFLVQIQHVDCTSSSVNLESILWSLVRC